MSQKEREELLIRTYKKEICLWGLWLVLYLADTFLPADTFSGVMLTGGLFSIYILLPVFSFAGMLIFPYRLGMAEHLGYTLQSYLLSTIAVFLVSHTWQWILLLFLVLFPCLMAWLIQKGIHSLKFMMKASAYKR